MLLVVLAPAAHAGWDETRKQFLEPLSRELHNHLPTYARQKDLCRSRVRLR